MSSKNIVQRTWGVSLLTLCSRILGLVRDKALVLIFGTSGGLLDAFFLAFTIPNLFRRIFGEGALSGAFIPAFVDYRENREAGEANKFASAVSTCLLLVLGIIAVLGVSACLAASRIPDISSQKIMALKLTAVMLPFMPLICLSALFSGMLQSVRSFLLPAAMPVLLNLAMLSVLGYIYFINPEIDLNKAIFYVAAFVVTAGMVQVLAQLPFLWYKGVRVGISWQFGHDGVRQVLKAMGPTVAGLVVFQINVLVDRLLAYLLIEGDGALTHLYLGNRLMQLPLALFGVALATTAFPDIVSHLSRKEWEPLLGKLSCSVRFLLFIMVPASLGLIAVSEPVIRMIFQEPDLIFSDDSVYRTARVLALYAPGLVFIALQLLLTRVFYASGDYTTPVKISVKMVAFNLVLNLILIQAPDLYMHWARQVNVSLAEGGLALSTSVTALFTAFILWKNLCVKLRTKENRKLWDENVAKVGDAATRICIAGILTAVFAWLVARSINVEPELMMRLQRGLAAVIAGIAGYVVLCYTIPVPEIEEFVWKSKKKTDEE